MNRRELGQAGEDAAWDHLRRAGYSLLARNLRTRAGEVDLIVTRGDTIVFVEVRGRSSSRFGTPLESVDRRKQARVARLAMEYVARNRIADRRIRFDVVAVEWQDGRPTVNHLENAFEVPQ